LNKLKPKRRLAVFGVVAVCAAALLMIFSHRVLWSLGALLDSSEPPQKADMIVVIGGDLRGNRILKAAELVREGYGPKVLVSGQDAMFGRHESDMAIDFAVEHNYPRDEFIPLRYPALSTVDEAAADIRQLRELGVHKYILVTSPYHTARAARIFRREGRREGAGLEVHTVSAPEPYWQNGEWWKSREGRKLWLLEFVKTMADWFRI
jgi:uncharacterized SAM-binding protein YcdF (DUF218 family)